MFLRELADPVIPDDLQPLFINLQHKYCQDKPNLVPRVKELVHRMFINPSFTLPQIRVCKGRPILDGFLSLLDEDSWLTLEFWRILTKFGRKLEFSLDVIDLGPLLVNLCWLYEYFPQECHNWTVNYWGICVSSCCTSREVLMVTRWRHSLSQLCLVPTSSGVERASTGCAIRRTSMLSCCLCFKNTRKSSG